MVIMKFSMLIKEIFNFQDSRIVFVGEINEGINFIKSCECEIYINDIFFSRVNIEGEMIAKGNQSSLRSLSSTDKIDTSKIPYHHAEVRLICNQ